MNYYFAPLEGVIDSVYRRAHNTYFPGVTRYYMPFLSPTVHRSLTPREARELPPADSVAFEAVPQLLTKVPEDFLWAAQTCRDLGYREVNLNLGCPSGTVTAKGKGSGMLRDPDGLDCFLHDIFAKAPLPISVKTRLGFSSPEEFPRLLEVLNRYPIHELTVHPRVRNAFYSGAVELEGFRYALQNSKAPVCYNGDLCSLAEVRAFEAAFPQVQSVMLGRGLVGDPGMLSPGGTTKEALKPFTDMLLEEYQAAFGGARNAMFRLKEHWRYLLCLFEGGEKLGKQLRKTTDLGQYQAITARILQTLPLRHTLQPDWEHSSVLLTP
ncbi:MAG: tRNA-dihydrouridine synthase family protein [Oscillospiraceae bacterium]|nr:tRNA-dihydrouridine synthase family protein [Oscillospiraceae bacterium]